LITDRFRILEKPPSVKKIKRSKLLAQFSQIIHAALFMRRASTPMLKHIPQTHGA
jgi:hypothetical protein